MSDNDNTDDGPNAQEMSEQIREALGRFEDNVEELNESAEEVFEDEDATVIAYGITGVAFDPERGIKPFGGRVMNHEFGGTGDLPMIGVMLEVIKEWNSQLAEGALEVGLRDQMEQSGEPSISDLIENAEVMEAPVVEDMFGGGDAEEPEGFGSAFQ